jgi:hypothetical protein
MRERIALAIVLTGLFACANGCRKQVDKAAFISAINKSYNGQHVCVWPEPRKLPAQADPSKDEKTPGYDALTNGGLLIREYVKISNLASAPFRSINTACRTRDTPPGLPIQIILTPATSASATSTSPPSTKPPPTTPPTPRNTPSVTNMRLKASPVGPAPLNQ